MNRLSSDALISVAAIALACMIQYLTFHGSALFAFFGLPGLLVALLIEGPHGGSHTQTVISGVASILVNSCQNFFVVRAIGRKLSNREGPPSIL